MKKKGHSTEEDKVIGQNLKRLRLSFGMSQQDVSDQIGVTFQQFQKYEQGTNRISASRLLKLAKALNVELITLFDGLIEKDSDQPDLIDMDVQMIKLVRMLNQKDNKDEIIKSFIALLSNKN